MSLIPEILQQKSLLHQALFPALFNTQAGPASPSPAAGAAANVAAPAPAPGLRGFLGQVFGGADDPRLSEEENAQARKMALIRGGLATMAAAQQSGASALGSVAEGALFGQQDRAQQNEQVYGRTQAERVRNALADPALTAKLTPEQRTMIGLLPPAEAAKALQEILFRPPQLTNVPQGNVVLGPDGKPVFSNPAAPQAPNVSSAMKDALAEFGVPSLDVYNQLSLAAQKAIRDRADAIRKAGGSTTTINLPQGEKKAYQDFDIQQYNTMREKADEAETSLSLLDGMSQILEQNPDATGGMAEVTKGMRSMLVNSGFVDKDLVKDQQVFDKFSKQLMFSQVRALGGRILQSEIAMMNKTVPSLSNTPEANRLIIEAMRRIEAAKIEKADLADQWLQEHGTIVGFNTFLRQYAKEHPIFEGLFQKAPF